MLPAWGLLRLSWKAAFLPASLALVLGAGCRKPVVDLENLACEDGRCLAGYVCNPLNDRCAQMLDIGCAQPEQLCPSRISTGGSCPAPNAFIPCDDAQSDCLAGCRTCDPDTLTWSECSAPQCVLGSVWSCASCEDDCRASVANARPICDTSGATECSYSGPCTGGWYDADQVRANGCECARTNNGTELCDDLDNDCDGQVDELTAAALTSECQAEHPLAQHVNTWACTDGACEIVACQSGWGDVNQQVDDGCEASCTLTNGGVEKCDGLDNDCAGGIDNVDQALLDDQCGSTDWPQAGFVATWGCEGGVCEIAECDSDYYNADQQTNTGCEYLCRPVNPGPETCDGEDNDCDTLVDDFDTLDVQADCGAQHCSGCNVTWRCAGVCVIQACSTGWGDANTEIDDGCEYHCPQWPADDAETECDGIDNDCDGRTDIADSDLQGTAIAAQCAAQYPGAQLVNAWTCTAGACAIGACAAGQVDADSDPATGCECQPFNGGVELCNFRDDDCDGLTDEGLAGCPCASGPPAADEICGNGLDDDCNATPTRPLAIDDDCLAPANLSADNLCRATNKKASWDYAGATVTINTSSGAINNGGTNIPNPTEDLAINQLVAGGPGLRVYVYDEVHIPVSQTVRASPVDADNDRALVLVACRSMRIDGTIDVSAAARWAGAGGGNGGDTEGNGTGAGAGLGGNDCGGQHDPGGSGAGFGGTGGAGGLGYGCTATDRKAGGPGYGNQSLVPLHAGSGGGGGGDDGGGLGGGGGGALYLIANDLLAINGQLFASGAGGRGGGAGNDSAGGGGGGSGGGILLEAIRVVLGPTAILTANGGGGGSGAPDSSNGPTGNAGEDGHQATAPRARALGGPANTTSGVTGSAAGGDGGADGSSDGSTDGLGGQDYPDNVDSNGGGGGGAAGRIRINRGWGGLSIAPGAIISPAEGSSYNVGAIGWQ